MRRLASNLRRFPRRNRNRRQLPFPVVPGLRVAQLTTPSIAFDSVESFPPQHWNRLESFRPSVLVGSTVDLQRVSDLVQRGLLDLTSVDRALFTLTRCGDQPVNDISRVALWQSFGVPVFELFISASGVLLASECEVHDGWHAEPAARFSFINGELLVGASNRPGVSTGLMGRIETDACPCGRPGVRIVNVEPLPVVRVRRALAATA